VVENKTYIVLPSPQIAIRLLFISIGIVVTFDIKINLLNLKCKENNFVFSKITILI